MSPSTKPTLKHIKMVSGYLSTVIKELELRARMHDVSKLQPPEVTIFDEYTPKLRDTEYGSEEYKMCLAEMQVALDHHYMVNRHHPEHHDNGINDMNLIDLIEMLVDWKAASRRHDNGNVYKSIEQNQERFGYSDEMKHLLIRTMKYIEGIHDSGSLLPEQEGN